MANWTDYVSLVASILGFFGLIGLAIAIITFCQDRIRRSIEADFGRVCCDKDKMGYFTIDEPTWGNMWKKVGIPIVPSISALIEAGDDLVFTSALFDSIPSNHEVCWKPIYEMFCDELAWQRKTKIKMWNSLKQDPYLRRYADRAERNVENLRLNSMNLCKHIDGGYEWTDLESQIWKKAYLDRHILYDSTIGGPYLLGCVRPLYGDGGKLGRLEKLWIYHHEPCIEASAYDVIALAFMLGMYLDCARNSTVVNGYGAFGMSMSCLQNDHFGQLQLAYSNDFGDIIEKPMGSGYSTLFAKHLACGSLPLGVEGANAATLVVNKQVLQGVEDGKTLTFTNELSWTNVAIKTLFRMPGSKFAAILSEAALSDPADSHNPVITYNDHNWDWSNAVAGLAFGGLCPQSTWNLLAAVRFTTLGGLEIGDCFEEMGGLIQEVHKAVTAISVPGLVSRFHLFGKYRMKGSAGNTILCPGLTLPSQKLTVRTAARVFSCYMTLLECITAQYWHQGTSAAKSNDLGGRKAVNDVFGACVDELHKAYRNAVIAKQNVMMKEETYTQQNLSPAVPYQEPAAKKTRTEDQNATKEDQNSETLGQATKTADKIESEDRNASTKQQNLGQKIKKVADKIKTQPNPFTRENCGKIARYIIAVWAHQAKIILWEVEDIPEVEKKKGGYCLMPSPKNLPDISAFGGV